MNRKYSAFDQMESGGENDTKVISCRSTGGAAKSTPPGDEVMLTLSDLEDLVGHVAGEANHAESERIEEILSGLFDKIEELLNLYAEENEQTRG
jgi:hypothetical protein